MQLELQHKYTAQDQWGGRVNIKQHPRKELCQHHGVKHADKMYIDTTDGKSHHIGYIVSGHWYRVIEVKAWDGK